MNELITERTPQGMAVENNRIKQQTCKLKLTNAIEVGKRLKEAKALLPHGELGEMGGRIGVLFPAHSQEADAALEEYGDKLFASTDGVGSSNSSALTNLTYYQALLPTEI